MSSLWRPCIGDIVKVNSFTEMTALVGKDLGVNTVCPGKYMGTTTPRFTPMMLPTLGMEAVVSKVEEYIEDGFLVRLLPHQSQGYDLIFRNNNFHTWMLKPRGFPPMAKPNRKRTRLTAKRVEALVQKYAGTCEFSFQGRVLGEVMGCHFSLFESSAVLILNGDVLPCTQRIQTCVEELEDDLDVISEAFYGDCEISLNPL